MLRRWIAANPASWAIRLLPSMQSMAGAAHAVPALSFPAYRQAKSLLGATQHST
jgi:hypothetical protein